jgi:NAD(P)H dehydrogenase (quinone)
MLADAGVSFTAMRNAMYADEIPGWFDPDGVAREPGGEARMSFSYRRELAEAIAVVLTDQRHDGRIYNITTPEAVSLRELAGIASDVTGDAYRYEPTSDEDWVERWRARGRADWQVETGVSVYKALRAGEFDVLSDDYRSITDQAPLTIREIVEQQADALPLSRNPP